MLLNMHITITSSLYVHCSNKQPMRKQSLQRKIQRLKHHLDDKLTVALSTCNPYDASQSNDIDCAVLWHSIEELSNELHDKQNELSCIYHDINDYNECWNSIECRLFNI